MESIGTISETGIFSMHIFFLISRLSDSSSCLSYETSVAYGGPLSSAVFVDARSDIGMSVQGVTTSAMRHRASDAFSLCTR
jgi:hypothetical protein